MKKLLTFLIFLSPLFLSGCFDSREVDDMTYVMAVGAEKGAYTFQLALPLNIAGDKEADAEQEDEAFSLYSVKIFEDDFKLAADKLNSKISKTADLSHAALFVFSTELAKEGLEKFQETLSAIEIRPSAYLTVADNPEEFLKSVSSPFELNPAKYYEMLYSNENQSFFESLTVHDFLTKDTLVIPISESSGSEQGCLVLKNKKAVMKLDPTEIFYLRILKGNLPLSHIKTPGGTFEVESASPTSISCDGSKAYIKLHLRGNEKTKYRVLKGCQALIDKTKDNGIDLLRVKDKTRYRFLTLEAFNSFDFDIKNISFYPEVIYE